MGPLLSTSSSAPSSSPFPSVARILQVSDDTALAFSRAQLLEASTGCCVTTVRSASALPDRMLEPVHMVVLCTSLGTRVAADLAEKFRRAIPSAAVIRLTLGHEHADLYDSLLEAPVQPRQLQATVQRFSCR